MGATTTGCDYNWIIPQLGAPKTACVFLASFLLKRRLPLFENKKLQKEKGPNDQGLKKFLCPLGD
jgi:hypothetical protein